MWKTRQEKAKGMNSTEHTKYPRQPFLSEETFNKTLACFEEDYEILREKLLEYAGDPAKRAGSLRTWANRTWATFQLRFTAGDDVVSLANYMTQVVEAFERYIEALDDVPEDEYQPPFALDHIIDNYVDYINILSAAVLLHREDLIPRICAFNEGTDYDGSDAAIEALLSFYLPARTGANEWHWKAYTYSLDAELLAKTPLESRLLFQMGGVTSAPFVCHESLYPLLHGEGAAPGVKIVVAPLDLRKWGR